MLPIFFPFFRSIPSVRVRILCHSYASPIVHPAASSLFLLARFIVIAFCSARTDIDDLFQYFRCLLLEDIEYYNDIGRE